MIIMTYINFFKHHIIHSREYLHAYRYKPMLLFYFYKYQPESILLAHMYYVNTAIQYIGSKGKESAFTQIAIVLFCSFDYTG